MIFFEIIVWLFIALTTAWLFYWAFKTEMLHFLKKHGQIENLKREMEKEKREIQKLKEKR